MDSFFSPNGKGNEHIKTCDCRDSMAYVGAEIINCAQAESEVRLQNFGTLPSTLGGKSLVCSNYSREATVTIP